LQSKLRSVRTQVADYPGANIEEVAMGFRCTGLDAAPFRHLYGLSDEALAGEGVQRFVADAKPGFPDRIEVRDAEPGETVLLLNYEHQPADTPYRARHAIFVLEGAEHPLDTIDTIPQAIRVRTISLRAFNVKGEMVGADLVDGAALEPVIAHFFSNPEVAYLHAHYAKRGCYAALIDRA
jgi:hypothetical protein